MSKVIAVSWAGMKRKEVIGQIANQINVSKNHLKSVKRREEQC